MSSITNSGTALSREGVATTAAVDLFEVTLNTGAAVRVAGLWVSQSSDVGDAAEEMIRWRIVQGNTTSGSGGASPDESDLGYQYGASGIDSAESFNTTPASGGSPVSGAANAFNIRAGEQLWFPPGLEPIFTDPGGSTEVNVIRLMAAPADSLTMSAVLFLYRGSPVY